MQRNLRPSSGIGRQLAITLADQGWRVVVMARREDLLSKLVDMHKDSAAHFRLDATELDGAAATLADAMITFGPVDAVIVSAGVGDVNKDLSADIEAAVIATNVSGFTNLVGVAARVFEKDMTTVSQLADDVTLPHRLLMGISSIAGQAGSAEGTNYAASKAYQSTYLQGLRLRWCKRGWPINDMLFKVPKYDVFCDGAVGG